jgi:hypothetical protein
MELRMMDFTETGREGRISFREAVSRGGNKTVA